MQIALDNRNAVPYSLAIRSIVTALAGDSKMETTYQQKQDALSKMDNATLAAIIRVADVSLHTLTTAPQHWRDLKSIAEQCLKGGA